MYRAMGHAHATLYHHLHTFRSRLGDDERGQGTVEYVGLLLLIAAIAGVVAKAGTGTDIDQVIVKKIKGTIEGLG